MLLAKAENKLLFQRQPYYVGRESAGHLLARLVRANTSTTAISAIRTDGGRITVHALEIVVTLKNIMKACTVPKVGMWKGRCGNSFGT